MKLLAGIFLAVGILIAGASGVCTLTMLGSLSNNDLRAIPGILVIGGIPFIIGLGLCFIAYSVLRGSD
jgi:hypothetical protein